MELAREQAPAASEAAAEAKEPAAVRALLAIVPARGGSRGVPFKNMRLVGDQPLHRPHPGDDPRRRGGRPADGLER